MEITGSETYGRIFDLTYDVNVPNKIYAITLGNHLVVSEDNGDTWSILYAMGMVDNGRIDLLKRTADGKLLTFIIHAPNTTHNAVLVFDIEKEAVIRTIPIPNQDALAHITAYDFYEGDMDVLIVDTNFPVGWDREAKVFYTADGGKNWDMIYYTNDFDIVFLNEVAISPSDPETLYLTRGNGKIGIIGGLFISTDAGKTYKESLPGVVLDPIAFHPLDDQTMYVGTGISFGASEEHLYKSTDGGETFTAQNLKWSEGILNNMVSITFNENNPSQLIVLEENEIVISEDDGMSFQNIVYPYDNTDSYYYGLNASYNPHNSKEIAISNNYQPLFSEDGGLTVRTVPNPYFVSTGSNGVFTDGKTTNVYYGVQYGLVHRDVNTGIDTPYNLLPLNAFFNSGTSYFIDTVEANRIYSFTSSFVGSTFNMSADNGASTTQLLSIYKNKVTAIATNPTNTTSILVAFAGYEPGETQLTKIDFSDINAVVTTDITLPVVDYINGITINSRGKITLSIGTDVYVSTDQGANWEASTSGLELLGAEDAINDIQENPLSPGTFAIATSKGIFISNDAAATWTQTSNEKVHNIAFSTETDGAIIASTYNTLTTIFKMQYSTDHGDTWQTISNEQLLNIGSASSSYLFTKNSVTAYVGAYDIGLVEYTIDLNVLGIPEEETHANSMVAYPNPTRGTLNIDLKNHSGIKSSALHPVWSKGYGI
ncbi:hypothetical protein BKP44_15195 [Formosa algae]|nr:hypothetical protein BKP44_15195 [Formosa algae]